MNIEQTPISNKNISTKISFSNINETVPIPNLLKISKSSYNNFLQRFVSYDDRLDIGLQLILKKYFGNLFICYSLGTSEYNLEECLDNGMTYSMPLYVYLKTSTKEEVKYDIQRYYLGEIPLLTDNGSFIINGIENTIINQLVRDSGVYLNKTKSPFIQTSLKIRGLKGRSVQFDLFNDNFIGQKIDSKSLITMKGFNYNITHQEIDKFLDSLKISFKEIGETFTYSITEYRYCNSGWYLDYNWGDLLNNRVVCKSVMTLPFLNSFQNKLLSNLEYLSILNTVVKNKFINHKNFYNLDLFLLDIHKNNQSIFQIDSIDFSEDIDLKIKLIEKIGSHISSFENLDLLISISKMDQNYKFIFINFKEQNDFLCRTIQTTIEIKKKKLLLFYQNVPLSTKMLNNLLNRESLFKHFSLGEIGRLKLNLKFGLDVSDNELTSKDLVYIIRYLIQLDRGFVEKDYYEEQSLLNRRFHNIGEQLFTCLNDYLMYFQEKKFSTFRYENSLILKKVQVFENSLLFLLRYLNKSSLCQYTEQANPLSYLAHTRKISIMGPGGLKSDNVSLEMRDVHISTYGRICPIETPEGKSVGIVSNLSIYTRTNKYYELETPYKVVSNGFVTNEVHYLTPHEEKYKKIARSTELVNKNGFLKNSNEIYCRYLHNLVSCQAQDVEYIEITPKQLVSISAAMIPFLEHNDGNRALMGSNMQKQAVPLTFLEKSLIGTGIESSIGRDFYNTDYNTTCSVSKIDYNCISYIKNRNNLKINATITFNEFLNNFVDNSIIKKTKRFINSNQKTNIDLAFKNFSNNSFLFRNLFQIGYSLKDDELCLGNNVLVGFTSMNGHTFEDSIVISERIVREGYFNSIHLEVYKTMEVYEKDSQEVIKQIVDNPLLDGDGVISIGTDVLYNDVLISKEKRQLLFSEKNKLVIYDKSIRYKNKKKGTVIQVTKFFDSYEEVNRQYLSTETSQKIFLALQNYISKEEFFRLQFCKYILGFSLNNKQKIYLKKKRIGITDINIYLNNKNKWFNIYYNLTTLFVKNNKEDVLLVYKYYLYHYDRYLYYTESLLINYKKEILKELIKEDQFIYMDSRFKNLCKQDLKKKRILNIDQIKVPTINLEFDLKEINLISMNRSIEFSLLQIIYALIILYYIDKYRNYIGYQYEGNMITSQNKSKYTNRKKEFLRTNYTLKMVKIVIACQHSLQVGDKLTGRYGNKGVISRILSIEDMPYLKDGTPVDIILNPLGVSSRMNIGQLLECHLGLAGIELSKKLQKILFQYNHTLLNKIRIFLSNIYLNKKELLLLNTLSDNQLMVLSKNLIHGINISTSIFDSAKNKDIDNLLRMSGLKIQSKVELIDGFTGTLLDNTVTVGYMYMMKLNHLIDHKIHGRSTGPYNVITQQASKGKSRNGGQRLGEMEVWALQAYGAAYTLQEMLTFKSDSTISRSNFLQNFIRGKTYKIDIPRTFKLLRDELRVLGMELSFIVKRS
uniref:DNA-directed RNA polymerase n=1 Tax=Reclinomonas americana ATCC 50284 TaxID=1295595 RepID=M4QLX8_RECAM|nr:RNA polymerase subunit beta [Reclinomonas americana ATCC 50284]